MSTIEARIRCTPDDLQNMPDGIMFELVDDYLVERNVSAESSWVAGKLLSLFRSHGEARGLDWFLGPDCGYRCFPDQPAKVRRADVSYVRKDRLPTAQFREGFLDVAPDLAVEVISPNDLAYKVESKVQEYLDAGVTLVWVIDPATRMVRIYRGDGTIAGLRARDELDGEDVLPGFRCRVADLFPSY